TDAETFVKNLLPVLLSGPERDAAEGLPKLISLPFFPKDYSSPIAKHLLAGKGDVDERKGATLEAFDAMSALALDQLQKRYWESRGWAYHGPKISLERETASLKSLFEKAAAAIGGPNQASPFSILKSLDLKGDEAAARDRLLGDRLMQKFNSLGQEEDAELRSRGFLLVAREDLLKDAGFGAAAVQIAQRLVKIDSVKEGAAELLDLVQGKGSVGLKMGLLVPRFCKEVLNWKSLLAMTTAPVLGVGAEWIGLNIVGRVPLLSRTVPTL